MEIGSNTRINIENLIEVVCIDDRLRLPGYRERASISKNGCRQLGFSVWFVCVPAFSQWTDAFAADSHHKYVVRQRETCNCLRKLFSVGWMHEEHEVFFKRHLLPYLLDHVLHEPCLWLGIEIDAARAGGIDIGKDGIFFAVVAIACCVASHANARKVNLHSLPVEWVDVTRFELMALLESDHEHVRVEVT